MKPLRSRASTGLGAMLFSGQRPGVLVPSSESPQGNLRSCEMPPRPEPKLPVTLPHTLQTQMGQVATCSVQKPLAYGESLVMRIAWTSVFASHLLSCPSCS